MTNMLNQATRLPRLTKTKFLVILAITGLVTAATLSHADSGGTQPDQNTLAGTWLKDNEPGVASPLLTTFMSDGRLISSRCIIIPTGPTSAELVSSGHGEWIRTPHNEFTATTVYLRSGIGSGPAVEFTGLVKTIDTITLNRASDQITRTGTVYIYDAANHLLFSFPEPGAGVYHRIAAGQ